MGEVGGVGFESYAKKLKRKGKKFIGANGESGPQESDEINMTNIARVD